MPGEVGDDIDKLIEVIMPAVARMAAGTLSPEQQKVCVKRSQGVHLEL